MTEDNGNMSRRRFGETLVKGFAGLGVAATALEQSGAEAPRAGAEEVYRAEIDIRHNDPSGLDVYVDGERYSSVDSGDQIAVSNMSEGQHTVRLVDPEGSYRELHHVQVEGDSYEIDPDGAVVAVDVDECDEYEVELDGNGTSFQHGSTEQHFQLDNERVTGHHDGADVRVGGGTVFFGYNENDTHKFVDGATGANYTLEDIDPENGTAVLELENDQSSS